MVEDQKLSWQAVRDQIRGDILNRIYGLGDKLPKDAEIAVRLGCARGTVQRAMQDLSDAGLIERRRKGGSHVRAQPIVRATLDIPVTRREIESRGERYGYHLLGREPVPTPRHVMKKFGLTDTVPSLRVQCVHSADGHPHSYEDRWIFTDTVPEIRDIDLSVVSANEWLVAHRPYSGFDMSFYAISADAQLAQHLDVPRGASLLVIERRTWFDDKPITLVQSYNRPGYQLTASNPR